GAVGGRAPERLDRRGAAHRGVVVRERGAAPVAAGSARDARGARRRAGAAVRGTVLTAHGGAEGRAVAALPREPGSRGLRQVPAVNLVRRTRLVAAVALLLCGTPAGAATPTRIDPPRTLVAADSLVDTPAGAARDKALSEWAKRASVNDLTWILDRGRGRLMSAEVPLLDLAFVATPSSRSALRQRWLARRAVRTPKPPKRGEPPLPDFAELRPEASVFRIAVILPDEGEYAEYGRAVRAALATGLAFERLPRPLRLTLDTLGTADGDPARVAAAFDSAAKRSDIIVGELLSQPTLSLATAATATGLTLVSPTATDERIGRI